MRDAHAFCVKIYWEGEIHQVEQASLSRKQSGIRIAKLLVSTAQ
jgi:hypothetical protein